MKRPKQQAISLLVAVIVLLGALLLMIRWAPDSGNGAGAGGAPVKQPPVARTLADSPAPSDSEARNVANTFDPRSRREEEVWNYVRPRDPLPMTDVGAIVYPGMPDERDADEVATEYFRGLAGENGFVEADFAGLLITNRSQSRHNGVTHLYFRQRHQGIEVYNGDANANVGKDGTLLSAHQRFVPNLAGEINRTDPVLTAEAAVLAAARQLGEASTGALAVRESPGGPARAVVFEGGEVSQDPIPTKLMFLPQPGGVTRLVWNAILHLRTGERWLDVNVDAENGALLSQANWYASADYRVYPLPFETPLDGARSLVTDPHDTLASPFGWHDTNGAAGAEFFDTRGNNVNAQDDIDANNTGGTRPNGGASLVFDNPLDLAQEPASYLSGAITNLFYWNNLLHDIHYQYGFDEASGNFQANNYSRGGTASDPVEADAQDGSGTNNANFGTPPDGSRPRMQMFVWTNTTPSRDSDLDNVIIIHEYGHGVSNRLTGGPANSSALSASQSRGMGEGWSDWWGLALTAKPGQAASLPRAVGYYVLGQPTTGGGIRPRPYTTNFGVNDYTYGDISTSLSIPHGIGFVWCTILWEVYWELVAAHGYDPDVYRGDGGNNLALQLVMDGLKLQPANPTYLEARDAIILADQVNNGGANKELLWAAFARRGMGFSASDSGDPNNRVVNEAFDLPDELFFIDDVVVVEGAAGQVAATFTVTLDPAAIEETRVDFTVVDGTATAPLDFTASAGTLVFSTGQSSKTVTVMIHGDGIPEEDETFRVLLSNAVNGRIEDGEGVGTIMNDDYIAPEINSPLAVTAIDGILFTYRITGLNTPRTFGLSGSPPAGMTVNALTGVISWTPPSVGIFQVAMVAANPAGSDTETLVITVEESGLKQALDTTPTVNTGVPPWFLQTLTTHDGVDAAQSGVIGHNGATYFETTVSGPDTVRFWWKVSSESGFDFIRFRDNGVTINSISGNIDWHQIVYQLPAGNHTLRWSYEKDGSVVAGADAAWVDELSFQSQDPKPHITSSTQLTGVIGQPFSHQILTSNPATSFSITGLPAGIALNPATGLISGIPLTPGSVSGVVTATNAAGSTSLGFTFKVVQFASTPYNYGFETPLGGEWAVTGTNQARTIVTGLNGPRTGAFHLTMDDTTGDDIYSRNELTLHLDLTGTSNMALSFWAKGFLDEIHGPPPSPFVGGADFDGVAISGDGNVWYEVQPLRAEISSTWTRYLVSLEPAIAAHSLPRGSIRIRFNHYDNFPINSDGFAFDDISVEEILSGVSVPDLITSHDSGASTTDNVTNFNTPMFQGTTDFPGATITLHSSLQGQIGTATASPGGVWSINTSIPLSNATHFISAKRGTNPNGPTLAVVVDSRPPPVPFNVLLDPESDRGHSSTDGITNDNTPTFSGDAEPGSVVEILVGDVVNVSLPGDFGWKATLNELADGSRQVRTRSRDVAGNVSQLSSAITLLIDTQAPNRPVNVRLLPESDLGVSSSDGLTSDNTPSIGGLTAVPSTIEIFANGIFAGSAFVPAGNWVVATAPLPDGPQQITARAVDEAGNPSPLTQSFQIVIDTVPPPPPVIIGLADGQDTGPSATDGITRENLPTLKGTAEPGEIRIFRNGADLGTVVSNGTWEFTPSTVLSEGLHRFATQSEGDLAGNPGGVSLPFDVIVDRTPPAAPSSPRLHPASDLGPFNDDGVTSERDPEISGTAEDGVVVTLLSAGTPVGSAVTTAGVWTIELDSLPDGAHIYTARTDDLAGNAGTESAAGSFTIDTVPPGVTIDQSPGQPDPALAESLGFETVFTEPAYGLVPSGIILSGVAGTGAVASIGGTPGASNYTIQVTGTTGEGLVVAEVAAGAATDLAGNPSLASTSTDNTIEKRLVPGSIAGVNASDDTFPDKITVDWQTHPDATLGYRIFRNRFGRTVDAAEVGQVAAGMDHWEDATVDPGVRYFYWVRGEDEDGVGAFGIAAPGRAFLPGLAKRAETPLAEAETADANPIDWINGSTGVIDGLLRDPANGIAILGSVTGTITAPRPGASTGGAVSATVLMSGRQGTLRGVIGSDGVFRGQFPQRDGSVISVDLALNRSGEVGSESLRGLVTWNGSTAQVDLPRSPYHTRLNPVPTAIAGTHTMILPALPGWGDDEPGGDGWATVNIGAGGLVTVAGILGDGTKFTEVSYLSGEAEPTFSLFAQLYRSVPRRGHLGGRLTVREQTGISDFDGVVQWRKFPDPREPRYRDGYDIEVWALGSRYNAPARGVRVLSQLVNQEHNAELSLLGPTAPGGGGALDRVLTWKPTNALVHYGPETLAARAAPRNGLLNGSYFDPVSRLKVAFTGIAFQKQGLAAGVFTNGAASGAVRILPGTAFDYPGSEAAGNLTRVESPGAPANDPVKESPAFTSLAAGIYAGILSDAGAVSGAIESATLSASGGISGTLWVEGARHRFKGNLDAAPIIIPRNGQPPLHLTLSLIKNENSAGDFGLAGNITIAGTANPLGTIDAQRRPPAFTRANPSPQAGAHTIALRAPDGVDPLVAPGGDAYGTLVVGPLGTCTGLVTLPEGTKVSLGGHLGATYDDAGKATTEWSFHRGLYGKIPRGFLAGKVVFRDSTGIGDLDGQWRWVKQAGAAPATLYPGGIDTTRAVVGSRYTPPAAGTRAMGGLANDWFNLWLRFAGPDLSTLPALNLTELDRAATWTAANKIVYFGPETVKITYHLKTGLLTGSYLDAANGVNGKFGGVLLQDQNLVTGSYTVPGPAGTVSGLFSAEKR